MSSNHLLANWGLAQGASVMGLEWASVMGLEWALVMGLERAPVLLFQRVLDEAGAQEAN